VALQLDVETALTFLRSHHHAVLATTRRDGRPQLSPIVANVTADGLIAISSRETAIKVKNLRRDPYASLCVVNDGFYGEWVQIEGPATILSLPDAMEPLVDYYRSLSGEHPDWADYRAAMERDARVLIQIRPERAGPNVSG
jgi:PPOX class probable F420-dependent enzyme